MDSLWSMVIERAREQSISLATWLSHARPVASEPDVLVGEFDAGQQTGRNVVEREENRRFVTTVLEDLTQNLSSIRTNTAADRAENRTEEPVLPISPRVDRELGRQALENPLVRSVLETFRGQIVDVRPGTEPSA